MHDNDNVYICRPSLGISYEDAILFLLSCFSCVTVPEVNFESPNITVTEPNGPVQICAIVDSAIGIGISIVVTAQSQTKSGAANPATGSTIQCFVRSPGLRFC